MTEWWEIRQNLRQGSPRYFSYGVNGWSMYQVTQFPTRSGAEDQLSRIRDRWPEARLVHVTRKPKAKAASLTTEAWCPRCGEYNGYGALPCTCPAKYAAAAERARIRAEVERRINVTRGSINKLSAVSALSAFLLWLDAEPKGET
jgi:hypothetical protein